MKSKFFASFTEGQFTTHQGHLIPLVLNKLESITDFSKLFFPYPRSAIKVTGAERVSFLNGLGPTDLRQFKAGQSLRCLFTNAHGKVIFDTFVSALENHLLIFPEPGEEEPLLAHLKYNAIMDKVEFENLGEAFELIYAFGDGATGLCDHLLEEGGGFVVGYGQPGLYQKLADAGFCAIGFELFEELRPQYQIARSGPDFGLQQLPQEAGLEAYMAFQKGCYLGQEPISRVAFRGRLRNRLEQILSAEPLETGEKILFEDKEVGVVTSASQLKSEEGYYSLAYLNTKLADESGLVLVAKKTPIQVPRFAQKQAD